MNTEQIPDEVKKSIEDYADCRDRKDAVISDCIFGYSLGIAGRSAGLEREKELEREVERLRAEVKRLNDDNKRDPWDDLGKWANENTF